MKWVFLALVVVNIGLLLWVNSHQTNNAIPVANGKADIKMRIFNSDGTEAEMCGNGIRCLVRFIKDQSITHKKNISIETLAGIILSILC